MKKKYCRRCDRETERSACDGRCKPCAARRKREARAKARGTWKPHKDPDEIPPGYVARGTSNLRDRHGNIVLSWEKTQRSVEDQIQAIKDAFADLPDTVAKLPKIKPAARVDDDLMVVLPQGDPHFGMYAWAQEAGESFDVNIARETLLDTFSDLIRRVPKSATIVLLNLGDFFHANGRSNSTPKSGHALDTDSRFPKVFRTGVRVQCSIAELCAARCKRLIVRNNDGNHDIDPSVGLDEAMVQRFWKSEHVEFASQVTEAHHWYHRFGANLIGSTHGDQGKHRDLVEVMAADVPELWGVTRHRRWYVGHIHSEHVHEGRRCTVETFQTTAPSDAWHAGMGYRSGRSMRAHVWHRDEGLVDIAIKSIPVPSRSVLEDK